MGLLSDDLEQAIITEPCNQLGVSPEHCDLVGRIGDLHSQGFTQKEMLKSLRIKTATQMVGSGRSQWALAG